MKRPSFFLFFWSAPASPRSTHCRLHVSVSFAPRSISLRTTLRINRFSPPLSLRRVSSASFSPPILLHPLCAFPLSIRMLFLFWANAFSPFLSLSISLVLYSTSLPNYRCRYSFVRSFVPFVRSFVRASLYLHISFYSRIPSRVSPLRYRPSPPPPCLVHLWSFSFLIRLTLLVAFERNGLEAVPLAL